MTKLESLEQLGSVADKFSSVCEPFDPAYLTQDTYNIPDLSASEKAYYRKMSIVINKLRRNHIYFEYLEDTEVFRVCKYRKYGNEISEYPTYMYIAIYDNKEYAFGGETEDVIVSTRISDVISEVLIWLNNNKPAAK